MPTAKERYTFYSRFNGVKKKAKKVYYKDDDFLIKIGNKIRDLRVSKDIKQMESAFKYNDMDYSKINRKELGKISFPVSCLLLSAKALDVCAKKSLPE